MRIVFFFFIWLASVSHFYGQSDFVTLVDEARVVDGVENQILELNALLEASVDTIPLQDLGYCIYSLCYRLDYNETLYSKAEKNEKLLELSRVGIYIYESLNDKGKEYSRLTGYLGTALFEEESFFKAFKTFNSFGNHDLDSYQACEAMSKCKILQSIFYRDNGDNEASIKLMDYLLEHRMVNNILPRDKAVIYFEKSIALGMNYDSTSWKRSIENAQIAYELDTFYMKGKVYFQLGKIAIQKRKYKQAIEYYSKAASSFLEEEGEIRDTLEGVKSINNIGHCYIELDDYEMAFESLLRGQRLIENKNGLTNTKTRLVENLLSAAILSKDIKLQQKYISDGLELVETGSVSSNLSIILHNSIARSYYLEFENTNNNNLLKEAKRYSVMASNSLDDYLSKVKTQKGLFRSKEEFLNIYRLGVDIGFALNDHEFVHVNSEKANNFLLYQIMSGVNPIDISEDLDLERRIFEYPDSTNVLKGKVDSIYNSYLSSYSKPTFLDIVKVPDFNKVLNKYSDKTIKSYCSGQVHLYSLIISDNDSEVNKIERLDIISKKSLALRDSIVGIKNVLPIISSLVRSLKFDVSDVPDIIIAGNELSIIPHELLYDKIDVDLIYAPSIGVVDRMTGSDDENISNSLIVTPDYLDPESDSSLSSNTSGGGIFYKLPYAEKEGLIVSEIVSGINQRSLTKNSFLSQLPNVDLVHYTGHAVLSENESMSHLALSSSNDENVYSYQIESQGCNSQMVVLNACNTNMGQRIKGEGIMSLTRSFIASGAKSVVSTLWYVDDQSSATIISSFYNYLEQGQTKSQALANAKKSFLNSCPDYQKHPYYWAGIVLTGDNSPLEFSTPINWTMIISLSCFLIVGFLSFLFLKKS